MIRNHLIFCVMLMSFLSVSVHGDHDLGPGWFELSLEELQNIEVYGPTRSLKSLSDVPASVTVFTSAELKFMGIDFLYELLNYVPGFQTSRDNDAGTSYIYSSRGSDSAQGTSAILLLIDGVPRQEVRSASASALSGFIPNGAKPRRPAAPLRVQYFVRSFRFPKFIRPGTEIREGNLIFTSWNERIKVAGEIHASALMSSQKCRYFIECMPFGEDGRVMALLWLPNKQGEFWRGIL